MDTTIDTLEYAQSVSPIWILISLAISALALVALWKIFVKAGEHGWAALIPVYNMYVYFKITFGCGWKFLFLLIPFANIVFGIMATCKLAKAFGKGGGFAVGLIFLSIIFTCILAFGSAKYLGVPAKQAA
ncbi:MAG: DUF5684 domain-containing protein [Clostridia bacterium]